MGNPQHLEWLLEGVEAWNKRRTRWFGKFTPDLKHMNIFVAFEEVGKVLPNGRIPLFGIDLANADLSYSVLHYANFGRANMTKALLPGAKLIDVDFEKADLSGAQLQNAVLKKADLRETRLAGANFLEADLTEARLNGARLTDTVFVRANLQGAEFGRSDLTSVFLDDADLRTLPDGANGEAQYTNFTYVYGLSQEQLDLAKGDTGVLLPPGLKHPDHWPEFEPVEGTNDPEPTPSKAPKSRFAFLSYARADAAQIGALHELLMEQDVPVWWDQDIQGGEAWRDKIANRLDRARAVLTVWTDASTQSKAVIEEAARAQSAGKLIHARLDNAALPYGFGETQWIDLRDWDGTPSALAFRTLVQTLKDRLDPPSATAIATRQDTGAPVEATRKDGRLRLVDAPANTPPLRDDPEEMAQRVAALWQTVARVEQLFAAAPQVPPRVAAEVAAFATLQAHDTLIWFSLEDAARGLSACLAAHEDLQDVYPDLFDSAAQITVRALELEPFIRPRQPAPDAPDARPVQTAPRVAAETTPDIAEKMDDLAEVLGTEEARAAVHPDSLTDLTMAVQDLAAAARSHPMSDREADGRYARLRRGVTHLVYGLGAITVATTGGVLVNFLTAPDAALTLAARLQPFVEWLRTFFL